MDPTSQYFLNTIHYKTKQLDIFEGSGAPCKSISS